MVDAGDPAAWAKANRAADEIADHGLARPLRSYFLFYLPLGTLALTGLGYLSSDVFLGQRGDSWTVRLGFGLVMAMIGVVFGGFAYGRWRIQPRVATAKTTPLHWLGTAEQKDIRRQILGRIPPLPGQLKVARGVGIEHRLMAARQLAWLPGLINMCVAQLLSGVAPFPGFQVFWSLLLVVFSGLWGLAWWQFRSIGVFLERTRTRTPGPDQAEG